METELQKMSEFPSRVTLTNLRNDITKILLYSARKTGKLCTYGRIILSITTEWEESRRIALLRRV